MSLYNGPPRGGTRGGKDQFNWESVKSDKDREFYLGHSVKALTGRWQKGKNPYWYAEAKDGDSGAVGMELQEVKAREEELMLEALGMKPKSAKIKAQPSLDAREMKQLMEREEDEEGRSEADRIKGVGYSAGQVLGAGEAEHEVLAGVGRGRLGSQQGLPGGPGPGTLPPPPRISAAELKKVQKAQKKEVKKQKKEAKRARKMAKKVAKKHAEKAERDSDPSSSQSEDNDASPPRPAADTGRLDHENRQSSRPVIEWEGKRRHDSVSASPPRHRQRRHSFSPPRHREHSRRDSFQEQNESAGSYGHRR